VAIRVAIAGAGIAGLTAALALAARGFSVSVFERAAALEEIGAGIQLSPNATSVLKRLGVLGDLAESLIEPVGIEIRNARDGRRIVMIPLGEVARRRYSAPYCLVHRADLQAVLATAARAKGSIALRLGAEVSAPREVGEEVAFLAGGEEQRADILIAADGLRSSIRTGYLGHPGPAPLGHVAWRATLPADAAPAEMRRDATGLWIGPGAHLVHYPVHGGRSVNVVVISRGTSSATLPPAAPFGRDARRLIDAVPNWTLWPLYGLDPAVPWVRGRVALIGDAAHAMAPSAAQGGAQAIEDAWVLAAALAKRPESPLTALNDYQRARSPRTARVAREALRNLAVYEMGGLPAIARNIVLGAMPTPRLLARLDWLFGWQPSE